MVVADQRMVLETWSQVLADGEDLNLRVTYRVHQLEHLVPGLTQADHEACLGLRPGVQTARSPQQLQRLLQSRLGAYPTVEPLNRLDVVVEDFGSRFHDRSQGIPVALKSGIRTSIEVSGLRRRISRMVAEEPGKWHRRA